MMAGPSKVILFLFLLIFTPCFYCTVSAAGGGEDSGICTLEGSIKEAIENNWAIKARNQKIKESEYAEKKAGADFLPRFSTSYSLRHEGEVGVITTPAFSFPLGTRNNFQWQATVTQPVFTGFALNSAYELAKLGIDLSEMELELEKLDIALRVKEAYFNILKTDKAVLVAKSAVESLKAHLKVAKGFFEEGMIPVNDLLKAEVELANAEQTLIQAMNGSELSRASFNIVLTRPIDKPVNIKDTLEYTVELIDFDKLYMQALVKRPEIKSIEINDLQMDQQIKLAKSKYYPEIAVTYNYTKTGDSPSVHGSYYHDSSSWQAIASLSWSFWNWGADHYEVRQKELSKQQLVSTKKLLEDSIKLELKKAVLDLQEKEKRIPVAKKAVEQGEENLRVSKERYNAQITTSTEVLDAQTLLTRARVNYYSALYDHHLAKAALLRAIGEY